MQQLAAASWEAYRRARDNRIEALVRPSLPILFFGDDERYFASPRRIVTVGLNPSPREFPLRDPFERFPAARDIDPDAPNLLLHLTALRDYFRKRPYDTWFKPGFEPLLKGLDASYYDGGATQNTALHTDICSPLATDPTWTGLNKGSDVLLADGIGLWHRLVERLAPDVILISVANHHLNRIRFPQLEPWRVLYTVERLHPFEVRAKRVIITAEKSALLVFGRNVNLPFGSVNALDKQTIGCVIKEALDG